MADRIRVGVLGLTHDHVWANLRDLHQSDQGDLVAAADPNLELTERAKSEFGVGKTYTSYEKLLDDNNLDAVYIFGDNFTGAELATMAANRGLHVLIEKPMASNLAGAVRMVAAAEAAGTHLMVNWPFAWWPELQQAFAMIANGEIGRVTSVRYRSAHQGPKELGCTPYFYNWLYDAKLNGAGALMDYCCYGAALARTVLGLPSRVTGTVGHLAKEYVSVDDNAVIVMQWPRAMGITEASWTQIGHLTSYVAVFYGTRGTLLVEGKRPRYLMLADEANPDGVRIDVPEPPANLRSATACFLDSIVNDRPIEGLCSPEVSRDAQEILEAGLRSAAAGKALSLPLPVYPEGIPQ